MGLLQINVLGSSFSLKAKEDDEYLKKLLNYYKQLTEEIKNTDNLNDPKQIAVLAGILLCDELYKEKEKNAKLNRQIKEKENSENEDLNRITGELISKIEKVL